MKLTLLFVAIAFLSFSQQTISTSITHNGLQRDYILYVPANYNWSTAVPLLFNFHGYTSNASQQMAYGDFRSIADTAGFIIVHPEGKLDGSGQTHFNVGWGGSSIDDLGFASALIDSILLDYSIDEDRVYSTGMSNGGFMSFHLACNLSNRIAAIASVTGSIVPQTMANCSASHATAVMQIHGTADGTVSYNGSGIGVSIPNLLNHWVNYNNCDVSAITTPIPNTNTSDGCTVEKIEYLNGDNCSEVVHFKVTGGGHTWPGAPVTIGVTNRDINASVEIWKFLSKYDINGLRANCSQTSSINALGENVIKVYPNPTNTDVKIKGDWDETTSFEVYSVLGKRLMTGQLSQAKTIDFSGLQPNIYYLKVGGQIVKIIKQ